VALRDVGAFHDWVEREKPSPAAWRAARAFIAELGDHSWQAPSVPVAELSVQPVFEVRHALLPVPAEAGVEVWYRHEYATDDVDLIALASATSAP
jgi:hypothetical protein